MILQTLLASQGFVTSEQLAAETGVSSRTVREDLKGLAGELEKAGIRLESLPGSGYGINPQDRQKAQNYLKAHPDEQKKQPDLPAERVRYILQTLLFSSLPLSGDDLAEKLFVSKSTFEQDLNKAEEWLKQQGLGLDKRSVRGLQVRGDEITLRYSMSNFLLEGSSPYAPLIFEKLSGLVKKHKLNILKEIIAAVQRSHRLEISDQDYNNLFVYLSVLLLRFSSKKPLLTPPRESTLILNKKEYEVALDLAAQFEKFLGLSLNEAEVLHLSKYLMQAEIFGVERLTPQTLSELADEGLPEMVAEVLGSLRQKFGVDFSGDENLQNGLVLYLNSLVYRYKHKIHTRNPGLAEIKKQYPQALEMAMLLTGALTRRYEVRLSEDEIGYIALFFCAALERSRPLKRVVIICPAGMGGSQLLAVRVRRYFPELFIEGIFPAYRLEEARSKNPDLILSTIPLDEVEIPVVQVDHLLSDANISSIRRLVSSAALVNEQKAKQVFANLFSEDLFIPALNLSEREAVIQVLAEQLEQKGCVESSFFTAVLEREKLFSTAIGNLVAIPHALSGKDCPSSITVGILKKPIRWGEEKVQLVFLLNIESLQEDNLKSIFERFYEIIHSKNKVGRLIKAGNFADFIKIILE